MKCCDDFGMCRRGLGCPAGPFRRILPHTGKNNLSAKEAGQITNDAEPWYTVPMLRITAADGLRWYSSLVGMLVPRCGAEPGQGWVSREPAGYKNFVLAEHAEPIDVMVPMRELGLWPAKHVAGKAVLKSWPKKQAPSAPHKPHTPPGCLPKKASGQSRAGSLAEALTNVAVGFVVSVIITALLLPAMGHAVTLTENIFMTTVFTVASIARSYLLRRAFNKGAR